ncbi:MAG: hypothetical protein QXV17_08020 [Candidatus Micrarchaeaceae archaeon]
MIPPDVEFSWDVEIADLLLDFADLILMWAEEADREITREEELVVEDIAEYLSNLDKEDWWFSVYE